MDYNTKVLLVDTRRVSRDEKYLEMIEINNSKMQDKQQYFDVNNGVVC